MVRPLIQRGVGQLEEMFVKGRSDPELLKQLVHELQFRQVPRAVALMTEVRSAMDAIATAPPSSPGASVPRTVKGSQQPELWSSQVDGITSGPTKAGDFNQENAPRPAAPLDMSLEEACKALRTTPGATWESIEQMRRQLVQQASPIRTTTMSEDKRSQLQAEARRVNAAYATLSWHRTGGAPPRRE